jgi:hypothetical protein
MKGDFTRDTFDPAKHYSRVLIQQGRVTLDADPNEQAAILLYNLRTLARDLIGPYAAPLAGGGFQLVYDDKKKDLTIGAGRYYVDGILVENDSACPYSQQPDFPLPDKDPLAVEFQDQKGKAFWMYLDVWERHITYIEDDDIREKALNGPDTCARAKVVWQVKAALRPDGMPAANADRGPTAEECATPLGNLISVSSATLAARVDPSHTTDNACVTSPDSKYRGTENQLYRVEIHDPGKAGVATFKWSRDNGSLVASWLGSPSGNDIQVGRSRGFVSGNWVELSDDTLDLQGLPGAFVKIAKIDSDTLTMDGTPSLAWSGQLINPKARQWNQVAPIKENEWIDLEDGVQIEFTTGGEYRTGDYWLIPARVATGNIEWPLAPDSTGNLIPDALPPDGIEHHYAPLGFLSVSGNKATIEPCQCTFKPQSSCFALKLTQPRNIDAELNAEEFVEEVKEAAVIKKRTHK